MKEKEIRNVKGIELRVDDPEKLSRTVCGYAIRFNEPSEDIGFIETIAPGAVTQEQLDDADIFAYYDHDDSKVLARRKNGVGTLKLEVRDDGVYYEFEAPKTVIGDELLEHLRRGELFGTSFGFGLVPNNDSDVWEKKEDTWYRTIKKIDFVFEISPVFSPAYSTTSCQQRNVDKMKTMDDTLDSLQSQLDEVLNVVKKYNIALEGVVEKN